MRIGISIPNNWGVEDVSHLIDIAARADAVGLAAVWTSEHLINTSYVRSRIGDRPYYHPLAILSCIAGRTQHIDLGTSVIVLPFHNPFDLAKYVATLDQLARGRMIFGVGVGNVREEFDALGVPWNKRGAVTDESIDVIRTLWRQQAATHRGEFWNFDAIYTSPKPYQGRNIPIWIGGMSEAALRRVARVGDGWQPTGITAEEFGEQAAAISTLAASYGRNPSAIRLCMRFNIALGNETVTDVERRSTVDADDIDGIVTVAETFAAAGATDFIYALNSNDKSALDSAVGLLAREVLPRFA
jgi:probable F420-dependent oxidoreductase